MRGIGRDKGAEVNVTDPPQTAERFDGRADARRYRPVAGRWLSVWPTVTLTAFLTPVAVGLAGTLAPAFGYLPALGGNTLTLEPWRELMERPGVTRAVVLSLSTGVTATVVSLLLAIGLAASWHGSRAMALLRRVLAPLLAVPHAALAIGLAFLLADSGWLARGVAAGALTIGGPLAEGWARPPALGLVNDPHGLALIFGLVLKETPFLLLMIVAGLGQIPADRTLAVARTAGYGPVTAWMTVVLPQLYPQLRLPIYAVLAYSLSVVDMAMILGPATPPTLAQLILVWSNDPDLNRRFAAAAGATLQLAIVIGAIGAWFCVERLAARLGRRRTAAGRRGGQRGGARIWSGAGFAVVCGFTLLGLAALALWSVAGQWRYPHVLPIGMTADTWTAAAPRLAMPAETTLIVGLASTAIALVLTIGCLAYEKRAHLRPTVRALWLLYTPLLVPQIAFLFGVQVLLVAVDLDGTWPALVWSHLMFVLPYVFLTLADPWRALDDRYERAARCLGASARQVFWRITVPMLLRPILIAGAIGFAVSVAQYLPTVFAGGGRLTTLTTEAVAMAAGGDRRILGVYAFTQMALPLLGFVLALAIPAVAFRRRRGMRS